MRKLVTVPMIHTTEVVKGQSEVYGQEMFDTIKPYSEHIQPQTDTYWRIIEEALAGQSPTAARFFLESYGGEPVLITPGEDSPLFRADDPRQDAKVIKGFIQRVGGIIEKTEDTSLIDQEVEQMQRVSKGFGALQEGFRGVFAGLRTEGADPNPISDITMLNPDNEVETTSEGGVGDAEEEMLELLKELLSGLESSLGGTLSDLDDGIKLTNSLDSQRDEYIASRIAETLQEGETGYLFLGADHNPSQFLPQDILVEVLDERLVEILKEEDEIRERYVAENLRSVMLGPEGNV